MDEPFKSLNKVLENRLRLQIMAILCANDSYDYNSMKETLEVTDGNLAAHIKVLENEDLITTIKTYKGKKPHTIYKASPKGKNEFQAHLLALEQIIKQNRL